jgi:ankyrin repeat protein
MKKIVYLLILVSAFCSAQEKSKDVFDIARSGTVEEMKVLVQQNKDTINVLNQSGFSPLILACYRGNTAVAEYLAKNAKDVNYNSSNGTALAAAAVKGNAGLVKVLLENKANPNIADAAGMTPLLYAAQFENKDIIVLLLKYKADKKLADKEGRSAMDYAAFTKNQEIIDLLKR